mmetsp:Transcript_17252/g.55295  ORF Transcript_17252/g.55295 Transcript_17252/m.55295 type:complete len:300 (+) Transcript_17252:196-1095(+)
MGDVDYSKLNCTSTFGSQTLSNKLTNPQYTFGTSNRVSGSKLLLSKEQVKRNVGQVSPGPVYDAPASFGVQNLSQRGTAPAYAFGGRANSDSNLMKEARPGPGTYPAEGAIGQQHLSRRRTAPAPKFGTSSRWSNYNKEFKEAYETPSFEHPRLTKGWLGDAPAPSMGTSKRHQIGMGNPGSKPTFVMTPGPGSYTAASSLGAQNLSNKNSSQTVKFGSAVRESSKKMYISHAHERELAGQHAPAPNLYEAKSSLGNQSSSRKITAPGTRFGTSDRFSEVAPRKGAMPQVSPGPGSYAI